jgi:hypothetical protein
MKNQPTFYLLLFVSFWLLGCGGNAGNGTIPRQSLCNTWQLANIDDKEAKYSDNNQLNLALSAIFVKAMQDGLSYAFFSDGSYAECTGSIYEHGNWSLSEDGKVVMLTSSTQKSDFFQVFSYQDATKKLIMQRSDSKIKLEFKQLPFLKDETMNTLYPLHNKWREKATKHESDAELTARLENLIQHYIYLLEASQERKDNVISFAQSESIIKIYSGGIGVVSEGRVPESWKSIFFDVENEERCYSLFEEILQRGGDLNLSSTGDWVKDDITVLKAIYANFEHKIQL